MELSSWNYNNITNDDLRGVTWRAKSYCEEKHTLTPKNANFLHGLCLCSAIFFPFMYMLMLVLVLVFVLVLELVLALA